MQRVDPFIPVSPRRTPPVRPAAAHPPEPVKRPAGGVDGFVHPREASLPPRPAAVPSVAPAMPVVAPARQQVTRSRPVKAKQHHWRNGFATVGLVAAIVVAGTVVQTLVAGELLIAAYAVYALVRRVPSRTTFLLALLSLATIMALRALGKDTLLAANFAVYSLLLAFVGVITLAREVRHSRPNLQR